jgi:hypothetical protein
VTASNFVIKSFLFLIMLQETVNCFSHLRSVSIGGKRGKTVYLIINTNNDHVLHKLHTLPCLASSANSR